MKSLHHDCCVLNQGSGAWAFETLARQLSAALNVPISSEPRRFNYVLNLEPFPVGEVPFSSFIPLPAVRIAADKRLIASAFQQHAVPRPHTVLLDSFADAIQFVTGRPESEWCLKYPTGCGASGHRLLTSSSREPSNWPRPCIVQEYVRLERPEVFRLYGAGRETFGWVARRFSPGCATSPWVAHARGARYERAGEPPAQAVSAALRALQATGLWDSFGCADLLRRTSGEWVVLEVGTDGVFNHVDRDLGDAELEKELCERIADAFWAWVRLLK